MARPGSAPPIRVVSDAEVAQHFPLVNYTLERMGRRGQLAGQVEYEDLEAVGRWAVWEALRRWCPAKGKQSTYLSSYIWGYVLKHQRDATKANGWHRELGRLAVVVSLDAELSDDGGSLLDVVAASEPDPEQDALAHLADVAARMPHNHRVVAERILADETVAPAADELGLSRARVGQIAKRVRATFAQALADAA